MLTYGTWVALPWLAPVLMHFGQDAAGRAIYSVYSVFCHQLPERSFFLFGPDAMYSLRVIQAVWQDSANPLILRQFIGNPEMGWKVGWSDRMVWFYTTIWLAGFLWRPWRRRIGPIAWWSFALLLLPLAVDGVTHMLSDLSGIGYGFRDTNAWLFSLAGNSLPFVYGGDALGSFNSWARLISGALAGIAIAWLVFPHLERSLDEEPI